MEKNIKKIYIHYMGKTRSEYMFAWNVGKIHKILAEENIKRKPKRAKREELEKLTRETFYR
jgi:hypothetical protein